MKNAVLILAILIPFLTIGQNGGNNAFQFLNFSNSARVEGAGGYLITIRDNDASLGVENPSLLNRSMHGNITLNLVDYFANSKYGYASYTRHFSNIGTFNTSLLYANYGEFQYADISGDRNGGTFNANDVVFSVGYGRELDTNFAIGADIRFASSFLESYSAFGISADLAASYQKKEKGFGAAFMIKNIGGQVKSYIANQSEPIPLNVLIGVSKKMAHAPFRFSLTYDNIQKWNLVYFDASQESSVDALTGETIEVKEPGFGTKLMYHLTLGGELLLSKNFNIQFGYNYKKRQDLKVVAKKGAAGFSWGFGMQIKKFKLSYGMGKYHIAGTTNHITLSTRIGGEPKSDGFYIQDQD